MKKIIFILMLLLLTSCTRDSTLVCIDEEDYNIKESEQKFLLNQTIISSLSLEFCNSEKDRIKSDLDTSNLEIIDLKLLVLNQSTCDNKPKDCTSCTRLLNKKEIALEECYFNSTIINVNRTYINHTLVSLYDNCTDKLKEINDTMFN